MASYTFEEGYPGPKARHLLHHKPQVLINILDGIARVRPATPYGEYPISITGYDKGLRRITHGELANAVNGAAWWLTEQLGHGKDFQTLCYMGWKDFRYVVFILGAVKVGYKCSAVMVMIEAIAGQTAYVFPPAATIPSPTGHTSARLAIGARFAVKHL